MHGRVTAQAALLIVLLALSSARAALAAGAVEMQVERIVVTAIDEYNAAMEAGDPAGWLKYFTDSVKRRDPLAAQSGRQEFADYYAREFKTLQMKWTTKKMLIMGRSAAVEFEWAGTHKDSNTPVKLDAVAMLEMASSGRFESINFYFDTAKAGTALAQPTAAR